MFSQAKRVSRILSTEGHGGVHGRGMHGGGGGGAVHGRRDGHRILLECILVIFAHRHLFKIKIKLHLSTCFPAIMMVM